MQSCRRSFAFLLLAALFLLSTARSPQAQHGHLAALDGLQPDIDASGAFVINSCSTVWVENIPFQLCDTLSEIVAFHLLHTDKQTVAFYVAVWNTSGTNFTFHPQSTMLLVNPRGGPRLEYLLDKPITLDAIPYSEIEKRIRKKERRAAVARMLSYTFESIADASATNADALTQRSHFDQRRVAFKNELLELSQSNQNLLAGYAKSNTLSDGMVTAGRIEFPPISVKEDRNYFAIQLDINTSKFVYYSTLEWRYQASQRIDWELPEHQQRISELTKALWTRIFAIPRACQDGTLSGSWLGAARCALAVPNGSQASFHEVRKRARASFAQLAERDYDIHYTDIWSETIDPRAHHTYVAIDDYFLCLSYVPSKETELLIINFAPGRQLSD